MFQATRRRLAIWYTAVTAVLLLVFASGVYLYFRSTLIERIDDTLNHVVEIVERSIDPAYSDTGQLRLNLEATFRDNPGTVEDDRIDLEWFSPTGELVWSTFSEPLNIPIHNNPTGETVRVTKGDVNDSSPLYGRTAVPPYSLLLRQVTERVQIGRQVVGYLRVSHPWFEVTKPIRQLILDLILGAGLTLICVAAIGWLLSGLAMAPVRESYGRLKQFTADASHELRNPIATIQTNVQVALAEPDIEPQQHQQLQVIERLTRRLGRLVDDLLFLARQDSGIVQQQWIDVPLDALLMEVIEEQQAIATTQNLSLSLEIVDLPNAEDNFTLLGDWDQLARLFTNLVSNAVQYTPSGGEIEVELQLAAKNKRNSPMLNPALQIKVTDTGIGISAEALPHLFDRFYRADPARTHRSAAGSGLGLAIAKAIVENHRGHIRIDSQVDRGTAVTVTLPAHKSEASHL